MFAHRQPESRWAVVFLAALACAALTGACGVGSRMRPLAPEAGGAMCRRTIASGGRAAVHPLRWAWSQGDSADLDRWCRAVGPAVVRELAGDAGSVADSIAVVTWNVHVGGGDVSRFVGSLRAGRLTAGVPVRDFVLLVQEALRADSSAVPADPAPGAGVPHRIVEAPRGNAPVEVVRLADSLGLALAYAPSMRNGRDTREDRGNAILSTLPLRDVRAVELPFEAQRRVALTATVAGRSSAGCAWSARVTDVHLDNRSSWQAPTRSLGTGRLRQGRGLLAALGGEDTTRVHLLAGDLNTARGTAEEVVELFRTAFPQSPRPVYVRTHVTGFHLDHVFVRSPYGRPPFSRRAGDRFGSDHYPVVTWLRVAAAGGACSR